MSNRGLRYEDHLGGDAELATSSPRSELDSRLRSLVDRLGAAENGTSLETYLATYAASTRFPDMDFVDESIRKGADDARA